MHIDGADPDLLFAEDFDIMHVDKITGEESFCMKILLVCGAGASSGFMAQSMRKAAKKGSVDVEIIARSDAEMLSNIQGADLLMVGPHLEYNADSIRKEVEPFGVPVLFIDREAYGAIDGEATLEQAMGFLRSRNILPAMKKEEAAEKEKASGSRGEKRGDKPGDSRTEHGFFRWMNDSFAPRLNRICGNQYVASIQESIMSILPMIMVGSVASIAGVLKRFPVFGWLPDISMLNTFSFGLIGIFLAFLLPLKVMEKKGNQKLKLSAALTSVALFFIVVMPVFDGDAETIILVQSKIGTGGMLVSVAVGIFTAWAFSFASKYSLFKKDTAMPDIVVNWVDALIPVTLCLTAGLVIYHMGFDLCLFIRGLFAPVAIIGQTLPGIIACSFLTCFLYSFGFTWILFPIVWAIWMDGMSANMAAAAAGQAAANLNLMETFHGMMYIGGQGATLTLVLLMMFSKCKRLKAIGRVTIFPSIFNVNEPVVFGAPVVWNPILMIPLWLNSIILPIVMYAALHIGFAPVPTRAFQMWYLPVYVQAYFGTGSVMSIALCLILTGISFLIWLPFFRVYEKQEYEKEMQAGYRKADK